MAHNVFSVPIFFIIFRETLEAAIIVAALLGLVEQIVHSDSDRLGEQESQSLDKNEHSHLSSRALSGSENVPSKQRLIRKMRFQVMLYTARTILCASLTRRFRSSSALCLVSSLLPQSVRLLLLSGSPGRQTFTKNPKKSGRVGTLRHLVETFVQFHGARYIRAHRLSFNFHHGYRHAQARPRQDQMAHQASTRIRGTA